MMIELRLEEVSIEVVGEAFTSESVPQSKRTIYQQKE